MQIPLSLDVKCEVNNDFKNQHNKKDCKQAVLLISTTESNTKNYSPSALGFLSSTNTAPLPPSFGGAEQNANTSGN